MMDEATQRLIHSRENYSSPTVLHQNWDNLLFLHWKCSPEDIRHRIPPELSVDLYCGDAYISIVVFCMNAVRPSGMPPLPWISYFNELNVRAYVRDQANEPGVYFFSLDCDRAPAVWIAQAMFNLPYRHSTMTFSRNHGSQFDYTMTCRRKGTTDTARYTWSEPPSLQTLEPGTVEFFLTERYRFFTKKKGVLFQGQVSHAPYQMGLPRLAESSGLPLTWEGFPHHNRPPDIALYSPGVRIKASPLTVVMCKSPCQ